MNWTQIDKLEGCILAIDFGISGGFAWNKGELLLTREMPKTQSEILESIKSIEPDCVIAENVHAMPAQGVVSTATFMRGVGFIEGVVMTMNIPMTLINPLKWVEFTTLKRTKDFRNSKDKPDKLQWKKHLLWCARDQFPINLISLKTADAVLIWNYAASIDLGLTGVNTLRL